MSNTSGDSLGSSLGEKVKGAWHVVEGAGDYLRGSMMDFVDSMTGSDGHHAETESGRQETQEGLAELRGDPKAVFDNATDTKMVPPPPFTRSTDATNTGATAGTTGTTATTRHDTTSASKGTGKGIAP
ncbi:uncharacterized protein LAESUDRAFT_749927 [Laetiporus sulphureus 93-53]|uniref:CsbD-like domain-containing protein n=1 Tax=Laetiporus sulphureus 93-53 TaxID=1314785 RepID=A0A165ECE2_9APHY|nr:uncharacterized protein LAESUDRAFT_749927 [Laetiporus sulphureus 93-53]KZT06722.1 hypothetical protein LAESUDRAFT_749927 [Laetiporus sulphureus 93-53]